MVALFNTVQELVCLDQLGLDLLGDPIIETILLIGLGPVLLELQFCLQKGVLLP
jgi:hypothetical protein